MMKTLGLGIAAALVLASALPAAAATRHHHAQHASVAVEQIESLDAGSGRTFAAPDVNPMTAGSNCGSSDCGVSYNRLNDY
jgi:hypothetical protein